MAFIGRKGARVIRPSLSPLKQSMKVFSGRYFAVLNRRIVVGLSFCVLGALAILAGGFTSDLEKWHDNIFRMTWRVRYNAEPT